MKELEEELLHPTGINMSPMPRLSMDAVLISNECGIVFEVKNTEGLRCSSPLPRMEISLMFMSDHEHFSARSLTVSRCPISLPLRWLMNSPW